jgi:hypothetical protein
LWKHIFRQKSHGNGQFGDVGERISALKKSDHDDSVFHNFLVFLAPIDAFRIKEILMLPIVVSRLLTTLDFWIGMDIKE